MKLYNSNLAPNPRRVRLYLAEKGISIPMVDVDLARLDHKSPAYSAINAFQGVPLLELDDGTVIAESIAICRYFEELQPDPPLFGVGPQERAEVEMWQRRAELYLLFPIAQTYRHTHPGAKALEVPQIGEWAESNRAKALASMARFDAALRGRRFICGEKFTVADITGLVALDFLRPARIVIPDELVNLQRWRAELSARPSAKA